MVKAKPPESVTITYDLFELPTAQHKAGLAGLLFQIGSMANRDKTKPGPSYAWDEQQPNSKVHVTFTEVTTTLLFDDLYDAAWVEGAPKEKPFFKGKGDFKKEVTAVRRQEYVKTDKKGVEKSINGYVYLELTPALKTLRQYLPTQGEWIRLWRDLIWQVIRDSTKKAPYIQRAAAKAQPKGAALSDEAGDAESTESDDEKGKGDGSTWADLVKHEAARKKNAFAVGALSGALLVGAQSKSAEVLPFEGRVEQNLLLHFWPIASMVYVPRFVDKDGVSHIGRRDKDDKSKHFCLAIPDVSDLRGFLDDYPKVLGGLSTEVAVYRPKESLIDLAAEGGISFVEHMACLTPQVAGSAETRSSVSAIDYLHLNQDGNIVRCLSTGRVAYSSALAEDYLAIVGRTGTKPPYANPLFRRGLMVALLEGQPWFQPFGRLFAEWDVSFFVPTDAPPKLSWFWADARKKLQEVTRNMPTPPEPNDPASEDDILATTVHRLVRFYLDARLKKDGGFDFAKYREARKTPPDAAEARRKLAERLFLELRSRREQAFVDHFTNSFFSVGQYLGNKPIPRMFERIAHALMSRTDTVKTLTLMALSASGWTPAPKKEVAQ